MADSRGRGDQRGSRSRQAQGQQSGSKRSRSTGGSARNAPKKGDLPAKGTRMAGAPKRGQPAKGGGMEPRR